MSNDEYDSPWKEAIETYFQECIEFFFPVAAEGIDWKLGYTFLDKELQQVVRDAELGQRFVDKLVQVWRRNGEERWVLVHLEVQSNEETNFAQRMYVYHYRLFDRYNRSIASLAVLGDDRPTWKPNQFSDELWGCEVKFKFPIVKLLEYSQQWTELEASSNPFATVVMAHLKAKETRQNDQERKRWKLDLTKRLYEKGYQREDIINLFRFIDWVMRLPEELENSFWQEVTQYEEEKKMPYITSVEKRGIREGLLQGLEIALELKFGNEGLTILPEIVQIQNVEILRAILTSIKTVNTLEELRQIYQ
ncbi:cytosolic protein [Nostoc favosum]|uniref:Cytosolic protein n=1 Tax=Nostoc favosum CHAB5714 TaxID=2780399 RepID=A0ABS8I4S6_9NOSO|nr:cytosolic protein [Nostoc favosum]MCC5599057.1 cytosolic protein [Nostoc favosum CHAB5714]